MRQRSVGLGLTALGAALFGTLGVFGKAAATLEMSMATLLAVRFVAATAILWALLATRGRVDRLPGRTATVEVGLGVVYGIMSVTYFESLAWLSAGVAALLLFTYPVQVTAASAVLLEEPVTLPKVLALVAAVSGVAVVVVGDTLEIAVAGVALVGVASLCYTTYAMGTRVMVAGVDPLVHSAYVFVGVTATIVAYGLGTATLEVPGTAAEWSLIAGITLLGTVAPILLFTEGLARIEASRASIVSTSEPLTTVVLGVVLLGEVLTASVAVGALLILSAVVLASPAAEEEVRRRLGAVAGER